MNFVLRKFITKNIFRQKWELIVKWAKKMDADDWKMWKGIVIRFFCTKIRTFYKEASNYWNCFGRVYEWRPAKLEFKNLLFKLEFEDYFCFELSQIPKNWHHFQMTPIRNLFFHILFRTSFQFESLFLLSSSHYIVFTFPPLFFIENFKIKISLKKFS